MYFHAAWSNFTEWINKTTSDPNYMTYRQTKRLFIEHFGRRLLLLHGHSDTFTCPSNPSTDVLCSFIRDAIGQNGGVIIDTLKHGCKNCTHVKQFLTDLFNSGVELSNNPGEVAGVAIEELETPEVRSR